MQLCLGHLMDYGNRNTYEGWGGVEITPPSMVSEIIYLQEYFLQQQALALLWRQQT